jgi:fido (protein-threonine AMPylation protein)
VYLRAIHRQLFQDVYVWAGDVRTVGIEKGGESFCPPGSVSSVAAAGRRPVVTMVSASTSAIGAIDKPILRPYV